MNNLDIKVTKLINYFGSNDNTFKPISQRTPYYHMGATVTDAVLQAGLNYKTVVYPRVLNLLQQYSDFKTTCDFIILMQTIPLRKLVNFNNERKLNCIHEMSWYFHKLDIQNEVQLAEWLSLDTNVASLKLIKGVGEKTLDYLKMLCGIQAIAIDRHLFSFLQMAGIIVKTYDEASQIYTRASKLLGITQYELDKKIWILMSTKKDFNLSGQQSLF